MEERMPVVAIVVAAAFGLIAAGEGAYIWHDSRKPPPEPVKEVVEAVLAPTLAHEDTVQQVTETDRARWVCEGEHYDQVACMAVPLQVCAVMVEGGFLDQPKHATLFTSDGIERQAQGVADGVVRWAK